MLVSYWLWHWCGKARWENQSFVAVSLYQSLHRASASHQRTISRKGKTGQTTWLAEHKARYSRSSQWVTLLHWDTDNGRCQNSGAGKPLRKLDFNFSILREMYLTLVQCLPNWVEFGSCLTSLISCIQRSSLRSKEFWGSWNLRTGENLKIYIAWDLHSTDE